MSKNVRKILSLLSLILLALFLTAAIPVMCFKHDSGMQTPIAVADEVQPADDAEKTEVSNPADLSVNFNGYAWSPDETLKKNFTFGKILRAGEEVKEAKDAGDYTVYVTPAENCVWKEDGSTTEKTFTLTITPVKLTWEYGAEETTELYREFKYSWNSNRIYEVTAKFVNTTYGREKPYEENSQRYNKDFIIIKDGDTENPIKYNVSDAGTYTFTAVDAENYENPTFTIKILPAEVNIGDNLRWVLVTFSTDLNSARVYEYSYNEVGSTEVKKFYSATPTTHAPNDDWENWKDMSLYEYTYNEVESTEVKTYYSDVELTEAPNENWENWKCVYAPEPGIKDNKTVFSYRENVKNAIKLYNDSGAMAYFEVKYGGDTEAVAPGKYVATAVIKATSNYTLTYNPSGDMGMTIVDNNDGTYSITKVWYVLQYFNEFIASSSGGETRSKEEYTFPASWAFGAIPDDVDAPCVAHGDEIKFGLGDNTVCRGDFTQPDGYALAVDDDGVFERVLKVNILSGEYQINYAESTVAWQNGSKDIVTFTLMSGDEVICKDQPRSKFAYYVNRYMPVGKYSITFTAKTVSFSANHTDWWSGVAGANCGSEYIGTDISFDFEVYAETGDYDDTLLNFNGNDSATPLEVDFAVINGDYTNFFAVAAEKVTAAGAISKSDVLASDTYWSTVADDYFDENPYLTLSITAENAEYLATSAEKWSELVPQVGTYTFYYQLNMRNYTSQAAENGGKYVTIVLYETLDIPEFVNAEYTGEAQAVLPAVEDARYTVSDNVQTEKGAYKATLTLLDPVHYRWKGVEGAVCQADYEITKAANKWVTELKLENYQWNSFDANVNLIYGTIAAGTPVFKVTIDEEGLTTVEGLASFTATDGIVSAEAEAVFKSLKVGTYHLWASAEETELYRPIENAHCAFTVELAENGWVTEPGIKEWADGDQPNLPYAAPLYGTVTFKIVAEDDETQVYYDSVSGVNKLATLRAGRYLLIASVEGTEDTYKGIEVTKAFIVSSSLEMLLKIFLIIIIVILVCAVIVLVILLLILKHKKGGNNGDDHHAEPHKEAHHEEEHKEKHHKEIHHEAASRIVEEEGQSEDPEEKHPVAEQIALDELVGEQPVEEEPTAEEEIADEPAEEQPEAVEEPVEEEQPAEEESADEPEEPQPLYEQPVYQEPMYQPMYDMYGRPMYDMYGRPMYQQVYRQQPVEQPLYEEEEPEAVEEPDTTEPEQPEETDVDEPATDEPVTEQSVEEQPVSEEPAAEEPEAEESVEETAAEEPVAEQPEAVEEPAAEEPSADEQAPEDGDNGEAE